EEIPEDTKLFIKTIVGNIIPKTIMTYPIVYQDELVGVIELGSASYTLGEEMMPYIDGIISQMGIAIKNSMAYENIQNLADELDLKNKEIQEANRLKSEFLANMSHELRTPMNSIIGFSNRVLKKSGHLLPERQFKNLEAVNRNAHNLLALINDILDLSKIEAGKMDVYYEIFDIREVISEVADAIAPLANDKGLELGKTIENVTVRSDKNKIKQILINLLGNAIKFTNEGSIEIISRDLRDGNIQIVIKDTGVGINKEDLGIIFDEFRQVDGSSTRKEGGTGLGLSITKKFVEILSGSIKIESKYGVGTSFIVTIPTNIEVRAKDEEVTVIKGETGDLKTDEDSSEKYNLTILCIDDEKDVSELMSQYLSDEGYGVICANNGTEGVEKAKELHPDVITLDIMMPNVNGWEVISKLKQDPETADIPVIVISIFDDKNRAYRLGAKDYLLKPIEQDALINSIKKLYIEGIKDLLLVEDDVNSVNLVTEMLRDRDINIRVANNGFDGIKLLREFKPQLILLDLMMPGMDGFEFIEEIKKVKESADIPIIVLTAKKLNKDDREYLDRHVSSVLEKNGTDMHEMLDEISKTIRQEKEEKKKEIGKEMEVLL
ncbi:MAG: response regulator, partial [Halobacteriota archaeon]|nr:response regulator [Halobacteriota archaeon]